jgi:hypothetical protein
MPQDYDGDYMIEVVEPSVDSLYGPPRSRSRQTLIGEPPDGPDLQTGLTAESGAQVGVWITLA